MSADLPSIAFSSAASRQTATVDRARVRQLRALSTKDDKDSRVAATLDT